MSKFIKLLLGLLPYLAVGVGLYLFSNALLTVLFYFLPMLIIVLVKKDGNILKMIFSGWKWKEGIILTIISGVSGVFLYFIWSFIQKSGIDTSEILEKFHINSWTIIFFAIYLVFINPFIEEIFWRYLLDTDSKYNYIIDAFFAGYHLLILAFFVNIIGLILAFISLFSMAIIWRELKSKYNGLLIPIVSHTIADISVMIFMYSIYQ